MSDAITYLRGLRDQEMQRIGLMVSLGVSTEIAEAVAAKLNEAIAHLESCIAKAERS